MRIEGVALEDHRDVAALRREPVHDPLADANDALGDLLEPSHHAQRGRLAAPRGADQHHELAVCDGEVKPVEGASPFTVDLGRTLEHDSRHRYCFTAPPSIPRTSARCEIRKTIATGTTAMRVASASSGLKM